MLLFRLKINLTKNISKYHIILLIVLGFFLRSAFAQTYHQIIEAVRLNQLDLDQVAVFLRDSNNVLYISKEDLIDWRIIPSKVKSVTYFGKKYYSLRFFKGATYKINVRSSTIDLFIPAKFMKKGIIDARKFKFRKATKPNFGGFLNYDLLGRAIFNGMRHQHLGGFFTPGIFTPSGTLTSSFAAQTNRTNGVDGYKNFVRLNTIWQSDFPESMKVLRLGDIYSTPGMWGRSVNFGGIQWGTDFSTQPSFLTFPTLSSKGEAVVPSIVDLIVNDNLVSSSKVNAGPFAVDNIPTVSGAGKVTILTTDVLGRQQIINIPYYTTTKLLKKGLSSYIFEAGSIRKNYGIDSNKYANFIMAGTCSLGISNNFTSELRAEVLKRQQTVGLGGTYLLGRIGVINAVAAVSNSYLGFGKLAQLGFQRQSASDFSFGFNSQFTSKDFIQSGYSEDSLPPIWQNQVFVSIPVFKKGFLGFSYTQQNNRGSENIGILTANYSQSLFWDMSLNISAFTNMYGSRNNAVMMSLVKSLGERTTALIGGNIQKDNSNGSLQITRSLPSDAGFGYNLLLKEGERSNYQGALMGQTSVGTYTARVGHQNNTTGVQLEARGGMVALGGETFLTRSINGASSFALVDVTGMSGVTIYDKNSPVTKTNGNGRAIITNLLPYQDNKIEIQVDDLPLNTTITKNKHILVPYRNSGVVVKFPIRIDSPAVMTLIDAKKNDVVPLGAVVKIKGDKSETRYMVANYGEVYISDMSSCNILFVSWDNRKCVANVRYPKTKDPLPNLGRVMCR